MFTKQSAIPLHVQLKEIIRKQVVDGTLPADSRLPSEREFCLQYDISRTTVRRALADLLSEELIYTAVGKGTFVSPAHIMEEINPLSSFTQDMSRRGLKASSQVINAAVYNANDEQANRLHVPRGAEVVSLFRIRFADNLPISTQLTWLPHHQCQNLLMHDLANQSLYDILSQEYGHHLSHASTEIRATLADQRTCELLEISDPAALLVSEQTTYLDSGEVIEFTQSQFRADQYTLFTNLGKC